MIVFSKSENFKSEYCCTVVQIGPVDPIIDSEFLGTTMVEGRTIVVRKDQCKEGDILFYASNESQLNSDFLSVNNLFEDKTMNIDIEKKGYFNKYGRVRMIKLRGQYSMGYLFGFDELKTWCPKLELTDIPEVGTDFDTINGELFVKAYVPPIKEQPIRKSKDQKRNARLKKFNRMIPGEFSYHYDTAQLQKEISRIKPDDIVIISTKLHGTSAIYANILVKFPKWNGFYARIFPKLPSWLQFTKNKYDLIYSSRTVIKNQFINSSVTSGYYETDVWAEYYELLKGKIPEGMTIYGEIVGYVTGSNKMIQKGFDYGCKPGENKLMIYRVNTAVEDTHYEWDVPQVRDFAEFLLNLYPELKGKVIPIDILYHGTLKCLYPEIDIDTHWHENVLEAMKNDTKTLGMELNEPLCRNKTPREGIVLRIDKDPIKEAWKLKSMAFLSREAKLIDSGEVDIEMGETNYGEDTVMA